jgi:hypothetical protein
MVLTKSEENEVYRIVESIIVNGEISGIISLIPEKNQRYLIKMWNEE